MDRPTTDRRLWPLVVAAVATAAVAFATAGAAVSDNDVPDRGTDTVRVQVRHLDPDTLRATSE